MIGLIDTVLGTIFAPRNSFENPSVSLSEAMESESGWGMLAGGNRSSSGVTVSRDRALGFHAFYRGCDLISSYVGKLPLHIYRKRNGGRDPDTAHPNYRHLLYRPASEMSAIVWKKTMEVHRMSEGNGYTFCRRRGDGQILEFVLLDPCKTWPVRANGVLYYMTRTQSGNQQLMNAKDVLHIKGLGFDGLIGYGLRSVGRESLGAGIATIEYGARYFRRGAVPAVVIEVPTTMDPKAKSALAQGWNQLHAGVENAHGTAVLTNGAKANIISKNAHESQLTEQKKFTIIEIANLTGLPPHKLGDGSRTAYNSLEQENQSFLDDSLDWRLVDWEQELYDKVLTEDQKKADSHEIGFDREQLVRADIAAKGSYYQQAVGGPWLKVDEARTALGLQKLPGKEGDVLYGPSGAGLPQQQNGEQPPEKPQPTERTSDSDPSVPRAVLLRSCVKMATRIAKNCERKAKKPDVTAWIYSLAEDHREVMVSEFEAPILAAGLSITPQALADRILTLAGDELKDLRASVNTPEALEGAVREWSQRFTGAAMERVVDELFPKETVNA